MSELWSQGAGELVSDIKALFGASPSICPVLQSAIMPGVEPTNVAAICRELDIVAGWAAASNTERAEILYWPADMEAPESVPDVEGGILAGEFLLSGGETLRIAPAPFGGMALWIYSADLSGFLSQYQGWIRQNDLQDLLVEPQDLLAVRISHQSVRYDVYWQVTEGFGLRPRLSLFKGFGPSRSGDKQ